MMKIASWNVNSLTVRLPQVQAWLHEHKPDVLALQETKLVDAKFPLQAIQDMGYHAVFAGQPTYNGVAIVSRQPIQDVVTAFPDWPDEQKRLLIATINGIRVMNVYVPNGAVVGSDKYQYKLSWLAAVRRLLAKELAAYAQLVMLGDLNIAPQDEDVYDPEAWKGQVLVSPAEREHFFALLDLGLMDAFRLFPQPPKLYSWWDYRQLAFRRNQGLRIDHILLSKALAARCQSCEIDKLARKAERPSDHAPVVVALSSAVPVT